MLSGQALFQPALSHQLTQDVALGESLGSDHEGVGMGGPRKGHQPCAQRQPTPVTEAAVRKEPQQEQQHQAIVHTQTLG